MNIEDRIANFIERKVYGPDRFHPEAATLRTLIKFLEDHQQTVPPESPLRKCLAHLEAGEGSAAVALFKRIHVSNQWGLGDWIPQVACSCETGESVSVTFVCLIDRWCRVMAELSKQ